ncbi:hypothetical protein [Kutzneria kofuensis]|uniref:Uncharacterized protein n=1 Tax=Kutzneria kofuensis TaxID=103725 RepID=A0A7W9KCH0_9PSEU|nr:hypothetical protein [Kutzneria kofuensis]MBB5889638.1 hypothetical protein [Kutzneria kofuensis]
MDPGDVTNSMDGKANNVVQAHTVHGGVHITEARRHAVRNAILVALIVLGTGGGMWLMIANRPTGSAPPPSPTPTTPPAEPQNARSVQQCEALHHMSSQHTLIKVSDTARAYNSCAWPAPSFADADGFTQINVVTVAGPGEYEASDATEVDRITGPCREFRLTYDFGYQGELQHKAPFTAPPGMVTDLDQPGSNWSPGVTALSFYPSRNEVDVVHNGHNIVSDVACSG